VTCFFVYESNISGTAEWICAKFTGKMSRSDKYECQGQGHHVQETGFSADISGIAELICDKFTQKTCLVPRLDEFKGQGQFWRPACGLCLEKHLYFSLWFVQRGT